MDADLDAQRLMVTDQIAYFTQMLASATDSLTAIDAAIAAQPPATS